MARKVFAVRVNSMAEEQTVSNFTWLTLPLRANLSVASMARMTQIQQYYASEKKYLVRILLIFLSLITTPLQLRPKPHPLMKYFEAKTQIKSSSLCEPEITEPAADDMLWPGESGEGEPLVDKELDLTARSTSFLNLDSVRTSNNTAVLSTVTGQSVASSSSDEPSRVPVV